MRSARRCRLAVLASHPIQYFTPLYKRLANDPRLDLEVMFYRDFGVRPRYDKQFGHAFTWDIDQLGGYRHRFLTNISPVLDTFNPLHAINPGAFVRVLTGFDAVWLNGYTYPSNWLAALAARIGRSSLLLRSELRLYPNRGPRQSHGIRDKIVRAWIRHSNALLYIGEENRRAYLHYGARPDQLFFTPYAADVERFRSTNGDRTSARQSLGIDPARLVIVYVGKLTANKHPEAALELAADPDIGNQVHVVLAGSGPLDRALRAETERRQLQNVTWLGFVNQSKLPEVYASGDVFLMPSERETWGLVLNEAMAAGLVPVVSDAVGASADLITPGETGFTFPSLNWQAMRQVVAGLMKDSTLRQRVSHNAVVRSSAYSHDAAAEGVLKALRALGHLR